MKKITSFALLAASILTLSSCSGSGSDKDMLFGSLPSTYAEFKVQRDKLDEKAKTVKTEAEKSELIEKGKKLDEKWTPKLEAAAKELDGKEINITDSVFKVTSPISLTFENLNKKTLEPRFKINGTAVVAEPITIENTINPSSLVYIIGYDAEGNKLFSDQIGRIYGEVKGTTVEFPAGTPIEFTTLNFHGGKSDEYAAVKTLKFAIV